MKQLFMALNIVILCSAQAEKAHAPLKETHQPPAPHSSVQLPAPDTNPPPIKRPKIEIDPELEEKIAAKRKKWQPQQDIFTTTDEVARTSAMVKIPLTIAKPALSAMKHAPTVTAVGGALTLAGAGLTAAAGIAVSEGKQALEHLDPTQEAQFIPVDRDTTQDQSSSTQTQEVQVEEVP